MLQNVITLDEVKELGPLELAEWLADNHRRVRVIDVRTSAEASRGVIPAAEHLPLHLLPIHQGTMRDEDQVVFYCRTGVRSAQACLFMSMHGRPEVYNLRGGIISWVNAGLPVASIR